MGPSWLVRLQPHPLYVCKQPVRTHCGLAMCTHATRVKGAQTAGARHTVTAPLGRLVHTTGVFAFKHVRSRSVIDCYVIRYYFTGTDLLL